MIITRKVPLGPALSAAAAHMGYRETSDPDNIEFRQWFNAARGPEPRSGLVHTVSLPVEEVRPLLDEVPVTPAGQAWKDTAAECLSLTIADKVRPFDQIEYDTAAESDAIEQVNLLAETLRTVSPLLNEVADSIEAQVSEWGPVAVGTVLTLRDQITAHGLILGTVDEGWCDKHQDHCYATSEPRLVAWEHIDLLAPGTHASLSSTLESLDANMPAVAANDNMGARRPPVSTSA